MGSSSNLKLVFRPYSSVISPGFWQVFSNLKLNDMMLSQEPQDIYGTYSCGLSKDLPSLISFDQEAFNRDAIVDNPLRCYIKGKLISPNTDQDLVSQIKGNFLENKGLEIWNSIRSGDALRDPEGQLANFGILIYADLKRYKFKYIFAFPALTLPVDIHYLNEDNKPILEFFSVKALDKLDAEFHKPRNLVSFQRSYFIVRCTRPSTDKDKIDDVEIFALCDHDKAQKCNHNSSLYFAYTEPSGCLKTPGWPLRNYIYLIVSKFGLKQINFIRIRIGQPSKISQSRLQHSQIFAVKILDPTFDPEELLTKPPKTYGWECDDLGRLRPKTVDLSRQLDPKKLASDAVQLNLRLMKWRLMPSLDLDKIANNRCLLLGCGTLGCHVARGLLAWGVQNITLVDNSHISYSNPVRQSLYFFDDCSQSGNAQYKAEVAAKNIKRIHPTINVESHVLSIPMPGHNVPERELENVERDVNKLEELIENHDTIFLLTDTRESRWLPTLIATAKSRLLINSAIGFDTFLVQRHSIRNPGRDTEIPATGCKQNRLSCDRLGCYFCNDIVAPTNSTWNRTMDQQCTVSRPGVSMLVSALVIELFASICSSPLGARSPALTQFPSDRSQLDEEDNESDLGIIPHSIRGDITRYHIYMPTSPNFTNCSACSEMVIQAYNESGFSFLKSVFNDSGYLEEISGLKDLQNVDFSDKALELDSDDYDEYDCGTTGHEHD